jgi:hypothetical protein
MTTTTTLQHLDQLKELYAAGFHDEFLDSALQKLIERQIARDENDLAQINAQLLEFEQAYRLTSDEFWRRYQDGQMADTADFMEWNILCKMRQRVLARLKILRNGRVHE